MWNGWNKNAAAHAKLHIERFPRYDASYSYGQWHCTTESTEISMQACGSWFLFRLGAFTSAIEENLVKHGESRMQRWLSPIVCMLMHTVCQDIVQCMGIHYLHTWVLLWRIVIQSKTCRICHSKTSLLADRTMVFMKKKEAVLFCAIVAEK